MTTSRDVLASSPDTCPGQFSWDYDRAEIRPMAIEIAPTYGPAYLNRGNVYSKQGNLDAAIIGKAAAAGEYPIELA